MPIRFASGADHRSAGGKEGPHEVGQINVRHQSSPTAYQKPRQDCSSRIWRGPMEGAQRVTDIGPADSHLNWSIRKADRTPIWYGSARHALRGDR